MRARTSRVPTAASRSGPQMHTGFRPQIHTDKHRQKSYQREPVFICAHLWPRYNRLMLALRYVALVTLVVWVGGLAVLGAIAAPVTFDVTAARHLPDARLVAGA